MKKNLITAVLMTIATTVLLGILYPLLVTGLAQVIFPKQANGELILRTRTCGWLAADRSAVFRARLFPFPALGRGSGRLRCQRFRRL